MTDLSKRPDAEKLCDVMHSAKFVTSKCDGTLQTIIHCVDAETASKSFELAANRSVGNSGEEIPSQGFLPLPHELIGNQVPVCCKGIWASPGVNWFHIHLIRL